MSHRQPARTDVRSSGPGVSRSGWAWPAPVGSPPSNAAATRGGRRGRLAVVAEGLRAARTALAGESRRRLAAPVSAILALAGGVPGAVAAEPLGGVEVVGSQFRITTASGAVLPQQALVGSVLSYGDGRGGTIELRIDSVAPDPKNPGGEVLLYGLSARTPGGEWDELCDADADGVRAGFPVELGRDGGFALTCTSGAQGKCVRFGYKPWAKGPQGEELLPYWHACIHMVRADYCGDGTPHTRDGTPIDVYDRIGIQHDEAGAGFDFEAAWGPEGAVCVRRVRVPAVYSLPALASQCPRLTDAPLGEGCSEAAVSANPAVLLMNKSRAP